jgi:probable addiction module antidote protein
MPLKTVPFDAADFLKTPEEIADYLDEAFADGDPAFIAQALGDAARARGMARVAGETGLSRESLYRALSKDGNPEFATVMKVIGALGLRLKAEADAKAKEPA